MRRNKKVIPNSWLMLWSVTKLTHVCIEFSQFFKKHKFALHDFKHLQLPQTLHTYADWKSTNVEIVVALNANLRLLTAKFISSLYLFHECFILFTWLT